MVYIRSYVTEVIKDPGAKTWGLVQFGTGWLTLLQFHPCGRFGDRETTQYVTLAGFARDHFISVNVVSSMSWMMGASIVVVIRGSTSICGSSKSITIPSVLTL